RAPHLPTARPLFDQDVIVSPADASSYIHLHELLHLIIHRQKANPRKERILEEVKKIDNQMGSATLVDAGDIQDELVSRISKLVETGLEGFELSMEEELFIDHWLFDHADELGFSEDDKSEMVWHVYDRYERVASDIA